MGVFIKVNDAWTPAQRVYVKRNGVWRPGEKVFVRESGTYQLGYEYDKTPSAVPELSLQIVDNRYIKVGARLPGNSDDADLKRVRVLVSRTQMPTAFNGSGFVLDATNGWPDEPWSDWFFHGTNPVKKSTTRPDSSAFTYKNYPPNPTDSTNLPGGQWYYFAAFSEDMNGNWSAGVFTQVWMPKEGVKADNVISKEANFQANSAGSVGVDGASFVSGDLVMRDNPRSNGLWFHGNKITEAIGEKGTPTIKNAKIRVTRGDDVGETAANVRLFWHKSTDSGTRVHDADQNDITKIGTIGKGETKWFDIPGSYFSHFNTEIKGFGLSYGIQSSDYLVASGLATDLRCGEVNVVWEEAL